METLQVKDKRKKGRPAKYLNPEKAFTWFDENAYMEAKKELKRWEEEYSECKAVTNSKFKNLEEYEQNLRSKHPDLNALDIDQLYILENIDKGVIIEAFNKLRRYSKPEINKDTYTVKIPAEKANEYSKYLAIANAFNDLRELGATNLNTAMLPNLTYNKIVLDSRSMRLRVNAYLFTESYK